MASSPQRLGRFRITTILLISLLQFSTSRRVGGLICRTGTVLFECRTLSLGLLRFGSHNPVMLTHATAWSQLAGTFLRLVCCHPQNLRNL